MKIRISCYPTFGGSGVVATELAMALAAAVLCLFLNFGKSLINPDHAVVSQVASPADP